LTNQDRSIHNNNHTLAQSLFNYLPLSTHSSIILITQSKGVTANIINKQDILTIKLIDTIDTQHLFRKKLNKQKNQENNIKLIAAFKFIPLTIIQAAAYIKQRALHFSIKQYLQKFQKNNH
jgi:hypothetical protein